MPVATSAKRSQILLKLRQRKPSPTSLFPYAIVYQGEYEKAKGKRWGEPPLGHFNPVKVAGCCSTCRSDQQRNQQRHQVPLGREPPLKRPLEELAKTFRSLREKSCDDGGHQGSCSTRKDQQTSELLWIIGKRDIKESANPKQEPQMCLADK